MKTILAAVLAALLAGCGPSAQDTCIDSKAPLWNPAKQDNTLAGNERYWRAVRTCMK